MRKQKDDMQVNVAGLRRNIKNLAHNYSDAQVKVREATSNDPWGPSATIMAEIADLTYNVVAFSEIMQMIWKRLNDHGKNWRHVYKALILLEYLIKTGTEKVAQQCKENIFAIQTLREFVYFEEGKDQGTHVREKAKQLVNLLKDEERLKNERIKALKAKERFSQHPSGFGSDGYIDGPSHRDMPPGWQEEPKPLSELEMVRPQTAGEEELQLQLAMAMSREEAEQEEAKRRSDDVRLQLALSQSEQDFKDQHTRQQKKEEPQSHLLDLLDISLGATSISSPPLGAAGGASSDPWGTPARAASQLSDPWSGTSSPQIDPWQPAGWRSAVVNAPSGAGCGIASGANGDARALRTQSPSVASGSSTEGWLQNNGAAVNGNSNITTGSVNPWMSKSPNALLTTAAAPVNNSNTDPWLTENARPAIAAQKAVSLDDPWAPKAVSDDPWKTLETGTTAKIKSSPDMDEFDIITNRNKTGDSQTNDSICGSNNNNALLLEDMDPLSSKNMSLGDTTNSKKSLKTPQAFLGENSSLVNLDNLIKPAMPHTQAANAAYNPFSDTVLPPKTNLFQQQQPAVPSINQLKQQQPFLMSMNQDPWTPAANTNMTPQPAKDYLIDYDSEEITVECNSHPNNISLSTTVLNNVRNPLIAHKELSGAANNNDNRMQYSKSDYDVFSTAYGKSDFYNYNANLCNNSIITNYNFNHDQLPRSNTLYDQNKNVHYSQSVDNIRDMQILSDNVNCAEQGIDYGNHGFYTTQNNSMLNQTCTSSYSSIISASLASTPGVRIAPFNAALSGGMAGGNILNAGGVGIGMSSEGAGATNAASGNLFSYGFYNADTAAYDSTRSNCKLEPTMEAWTLK